MVAAGAVDGRGIECRQRGDHIGHAHGIGEAVAGHRMKQAGAQAHARHAGYAFIEEFFDIAANGQRQDACFFTGNGANLPALRHRVIGDVLAQQIGRQIAAVGKIRVFNQHMLRAERQRVDEAIAIVLRHCRIHDDRARQAMRLGQFHFLPEKFLPPQIERG